MSLFIEPSLEALAAAKEIKAPVVELHTGAWCHALEIGETEKAEAEFARLRAAAAEAEKLGIECHAGHGLDFDTARKIAAFPQIVELNIGHFLVAEAVFIGLEASVKRMIAAISEGRGEASPLLEEGRGEHDHRPRRRSLRHPPRRESS